MKQELLDKFQSDLKSGKIKIGVWGCGYIGTSTLAHYANSGIYTIGTDLDKTQVDALNRGEIIIPSLDRWLNIPLKPLAENGTLRATTNWKELLEDDIRVHFICIPTEREGEPWFDPLRDVIKKLKGIKSSPENPTLIIIESTLTPGTTDKMILKEFDSSIYLGVAPRRDWFGQPNETLQKLERMYCGINEDSTQLMKIILEIVCEKLVKFSNHKNVELTKSLENSVLQMAATYAMQMTEAYPDANINEIFRWSTGIFSKPIYPSMGTGGYCIPLAAKYIKMGAERPEALTILDEVIKTDESQRIKWAHKISEKVIGENIGILGITYKGNLKVHLLSPSLAVIKELKSKGKKIYVYDPLYTPEEIKKYVDCETFKFPDDMGKFDAIAVFPKHNIFMNIPEDKLINNLKENVVIFDNVGVWERYRILFKKNKIEYYHVGDGTEF